MKQISKILFPSSFLLRIFIPTYIIFFLAAADTFAVERPFQESSWKCVHFLKVIHHKIFPRKLLDESQFQLALNQFRVSFDFNTSTKVRATTTPEQKIALIIAVLERFFQMPIPIKDPIPSFLLKVKKQIDLSDGIFTSLEAERLTETLVEYFESNSKYPQSNILVRWALKGIQPDIRSRIEANLLHQKDLQQTMKQLTTSGFIRPPTLSEKIRKAVQGSGNAIKIAKSALITLVLFYIGIPFIHLPDVNPIEFAKVDMKILNTAKTSGLTTATAMAKTQLKTWEKIHMTYRGVRKLYFTGLSILGVLYLTFNPQIIKSSVDFVRTGIRLHMSQEQLKDYESSHYDPKQVVDEQLQMWLDAQDAPPHVAEVETKRKEFEAQERAGIFKIYK